MYVNVSGCECIGVYSSVPVCLCENACVYVCVCMSMCVCTGVCVCVYHYNSNVFKDTKYIINDQKIVAE